MRPLSSAGIVFFGFAEVVDARQPVALQREEIRVYAVRD